MSYTPTSWSTGDTITAAAMNKIENGIANAGGALICTVTIIDGDQCLDKTVQEIYDALISGTPVYARYQYYTLGTDYESWTYLAPVVKIYSYDTTNLIRVYVQKPSPIGTKDNIPFLATPSIAIFSATGLNQYPAWSTTVYVPSTNVSTGGGLN